MKTHTALPRLLALLVFAALGLGLGLVAHAQVEPAAYDGVLKLDAFPKLDRPVAAFDHDKHQDVVEDCASCHHGKTADGKQDKENYDPAEGCATCHDLAGKESTIPLQRAYHQQCIGCHKDLNRGPTHCAGCHIK